MGVFLSVEGFCSRAQLRWPRAEGYRVCPMTLFDSLFTLPAVRNRHNTAPLLRERVEYLTHVQALGHTEGYVKVIASQLIQVNRALGFSTRMRPLTIAELEDVARKWAVYMGPLRRKKPGKYTYEVFMLIARSWLRFHSCLIEPVETRFADKQRRDYELWLKDVRGLLPSTIHERSKLAGYFLKWLAENRVRLARLTASHVDQYLDAMKRTGLALATQITRANALRDFLKYSEARNRVRAGLSGTVPLLDHPKYSFSQKGPSWQEVRRMISSLRGNSRLAVRDRAMILLMALYGLRASEVRGLRFADVDFENHVLTVVRAKSRKIQRFPLTREASDAIRKYINRARPAVECPSLFLTARWPCRPISHSGLYHRTSALFRRTGVQSPLKGTHAFRHACANRLMDKGTSIRDIGAFLGHMDFRSVREYARYNLKHLRLIAEFSLEGLL